jgi:predicted MPP superfamily phosphohydrolase
VDRTNALDADLVVITGDLSDGAPEARAADITPVGDLRARDGVIAVPGNHEYYFDYPRWMAIWRDLGLTMLENSHVQIEHRGAVLALAGLTDPQAASFGQAMPDLPRAMQGVPPGMPVILLQHHPDTAREHARAGVKLQLAGHTHGGQILGPHLLTQWANAGFVSGLYQVGDMALYVSNGTGLWNGLALRLGRPSEITHIVLRAR